MADNLGKRRSSGVSWVEVIGRVDPNSRIEPRSINFNAALVFNIAELVVQVNRSLGVVVVASLSSELYNYLVIKVKEILPEGVLVTATNVEVQIFAINLGKVVGLRFEPIQIVFTDTLDGD